MKSDLTKVSGLWIRMSKKNQQFLSGSIKRETLEKMLETNESQLELLVFKNTKKDEDRFPDYNVYFTKSDRKEKQRPLAEQKPSPVDDIPF